MVVVEVAQFIVKRKYANTNITPQVKSTNMVYFVGFILLRPQNLIGFAAGIAVYNAYRCLSHLETDAYSAAVDSTRKKNLYFNSKFQSFLLAT